MKKLLLALCIAVGVGVVWWAFHEKPAARAIPQEIVVGTSADFPPFEFVDNDGEIKGFDIEFIHLLLQEMGLPYIIKNMPFDTLLPQTQLASIHMVCSGLSVTPERAQHILMSGPYVPQEPVVLVYPAGSSWLPKTMDDLQGKNIIVNNGYNTDILIQKYPGIALVRTPGPAEAMLALNFGKGDGFLIGAFAAQELMAKQEPGKWAIASLDVPLAPMVVGVSPYYPELLTAVNEAIAKLHASGALAELQRSWRLIS